MQENLLSAINLRGSIFAVKIIDNSKIIAAISKKLGQYEVRVSSVVVSQLERLIRQTGSSVQIDIYRSLEWLILHEIQHSELGHFELLEGRPQFHLVTRVEEAIIVELDLPKQFWPKITRCLELQADHDASEAMLDSYSADRWTVLGKQVTCIAAVMILIEKFDRANTIEHSTHPKAATRIFQLLGHVSEMWSLPAHMKAQQRGDNQINPQDLPSDEEIQAFSKEVILPTFWDAVALAEIADAKSIISDLGSPEDFFADIARAKLGQWDELVTVGAREWVELKEANDLILPLLPINQDTN